MKVNKKIIIVLMILILNSVFALPVMAKGQQSFQDPLVRIKDITRIQGVRVNQLIGYGLVVGLNGSGDSSSALTTRTKSNMLRRFGIDLSPSQAQSENVAAVMVTAELPPYSRSGDRMNVTVASIGDADSLQGGTLLMTPLTGPNQQEVYAMAQGPISIGGFNASQGGNSTRRNHTTVGMIPNGAIIEKNVKTDFSSDEGVTLILDNPNFMTAQRIASAINQRYGYNSSGNNFAQAIDPGRIKVSIPSYYQGNQVSFVAQLNSLLVRPDTEAKVVINERTGTIVMGHNVRISTVSVAHGNLTVTISSQENISQPPPLSGGKTAKEKETKVNVKEEKDSLLVLPKGSSIADVVKALNGVGATPRDTIAILQAIKEAGALHAKLEIM